MWSVGNKTIQTLIMNRKIASDYIILVFLAQSCVFNPWSVILKCKSTFFFHFEQSLHLTPYMLWQVRAVWTFSCGNKTGRFKHAYKILYTVSAIRKAGIGNDPFFSVCIWSIKCLNPFLCRVGKLKFSSRGQSATQEALTHVVPENAKHLSLADILLYCDLTTPELHLQPRLAVLLLSALTGFTITNSSYGPRVAVDTVICMPGMFGLNYIKLISAHWVA